MNASALGRLKRVAPPAIALVLFAAALYVLRRELRAFTWSELSGAVAATSPSRAALAVLLTVANFAVLSLYDFLAFAYAGKSIPPRVIARTSIVAHAISNSIGLATLSGAAVRYRFYSRWGVTASDLSRLMVSYGATFWLGFLALAGAALAFARPPSAFGLSGSAIAGLGWVLMLVPVGYLVSTIVRREPIQIGRFVWPVPSLRLASAQVAASCLDWALLAATLYVLLPAGSLPFLAFLGAFLIAIVLGLASHVPGGAGVFDGALVLLVAPALAARQVVPALVVFRAIYYVAPFVAAVTVLVADELRVRQAQLRQAGAVVDSIAARVMPRALAALMFFAGALLLLSGATPAMPERLAWIGGRLPLGLIETSHFLASIAGAVLLVLSHGIARRLDAAYHAATLTIVVAIALSLLKGLDFEEAALLGLFLVILWRARPAFYRRAAFFDAQWSPGWTALVVATIGASVWLTLFAFKHVDYSNELWWQFEVNGEASRSLRAAVGASLVLVVFGLARLVKPAPPDVPVASEAELADAARIIAAQPSTMPSLVYLRDKALLFNDDKTAFVMFAVHGRTWAALGDPVGPPAATHDLIRRFLERCDDYGGIPVFYEVGPDRLYAYADFGLTPVKLGEEAVVELRRFTTEGSAGKKFRNAINHLEREGGTFRMIDVADVPAIMSELRSVSDDWLQAKAGGEKGFSLGFFDESYLSRFPVAVIECGGRIVAFANVWLGATGTELSVDLMRHRRDAPKGLMDALFVHLFLWGRQHGYEQARLGMAPLSGFERSPVAPLWNQLGGFLYQHTAALYNFRGLRAYKQKFDPVWQPHYLVYPSGFTLPRALADVAALIAGGYRRIFSR